jgi:hypothetical protein
MILWKTITTLVTLFTTEMLQIAEMMDIKDAISNEFGNLSELSGQIYDYWISELYDEDGDMILTEWNEETLNMMREDVSYLVDAVA